MSAVTEREARELGSTEPSKAVAAPLPGTGKLLVLVLNGEGGGAPARCGEGLRVDTEQSVVNNK